MGRILSLFNQEDQLIKSLKKGDSKAQRLLYDKYSHRMLGVCNRYVMDTLAAEDVMIEGFLKVFEKVNQFTSEGSFEGWIRRIMINEALGYLRKNKRTFENYGSEEVERIPNYQYADENINANELLSLIEKLPIGYRTVFNLYAIEGYSHQEISKTLNITESTSKSQLHRARAQLMLMVCEWEDGFKKKEKNEKASC